MNTATLTDIEAGIRMALKGSLLFTAVLHPYVHVSQGRRHVFTIGGGQDILDAAGGSAQRRVAPISPREARKKFFAFIFQLSGWALVAPSCFCTASFPDVRGLQVPGPPCMCFFLKFRSRT